MKKLSEQVWEYEPRTSLVMRRHPSHPRREQTVAHLMLPEEEADVLGPQVAAAPKLAQALLAMGTTNSKGEWHTFICAASSHGEHCEAAQQALREAGELPDPITPGDARV